MPALVSPPVPEILPEIAAFAELVIVPLSLRTMALSMVVAPVMARLPPFRVSVPVPRLPSELRESVPPVMVVVPLNVLLPESVSVPEPAFVSPPLPEITLERVTAALFVTVASELSTKVLLMVVAPPISRLPPLNVRPLVPSMLPL